MSMYWCYLQNEVIHVLKIKYLIVSFPHPFTQMKDLFWFSALYQKWFCTRVRNGWHFTREICCKNANPWRDWSLFLFCDSLCTAGSLDQSSLIETLHNTQAGFSQPHRRPPPFPPCWIYRAAPGTSCWSRQVKDSTWTLRGCLYFITRAILSAGCCLFHLASLLRTSEPWECGTIC